MEAFAPVRAAMTLPLAPLQYLISMPVTAITTVRQAISSHEALVSENLNLKAEQLLLRSQLQRLVAIESENNYLKALFQSSKKVQGKTLIAELLAVSSEPFVNQVVLNKGTTDNVYVGQPVLDATGIMGQIVSVGPITSRVLLINDPSSGVAVQCVRTGMRAVAVGDSYSGKLKLMYVPNTADIQVNDVFLSSGLGDRYPEGYPVGRVVSVNKNPARQFAEVYLKPSAKLDSSRQVLLIWNQKHA